jgi:hypothetical protein
VSQIPIEAVERLREAARRYEQARRLELSAGVLPAAGAKVELVRRLRAAGLHCIIVDGRLFLDISFDLDAAFGMRDDQVDLASVPTERILWADEAAPSAG